MVKNRAVGLFLHIRNLHGISLNTVKEQNILKNDLQLDLQVCFHKCTAWLVAGGPNIKMVRVEN